MKETKETKKSRNITFRLTDEEYGQVEKAAASAGDDPNNWCRKAAVSQLSEGHTFTRNERLIYQEIALLRFLLGHGLSWLLAETKRQPPHGKSSRRRPTRARMRLSPSCCPGEASETASRRVKEF